MNSSSAEFDRVCREVRARFPSAFAERRSQSGPVTGSADAWVENCLKSPGVQQVLTTYGKTTGSLELLLRLVAETRCRQMRMVWIDPCDCLDPVTAFEKSPLHLLWVRGGGLAGAIRVADAVLRDENFPFVCLDGVLIPAEEWKRVPLGQWYRLQRLVHGRKTTLVIWTPSVVIPAANRRASFKSDSTLPPGSFQTRCGATAHGIPCGV